MNDNIFQQGLFPPQRMCAQIDEVELVQFLGWWVNCGKPCELKLVPSEKSKSLVGICFTVRNDDYATLDFMQTACSKTGAKHGRKPYVIWAKYLTRLNTYYFITTKEKINAMTQQEAEGLKSILKRRKGEEVTLIEQKWEAERQKLEADRKHTLNRLHEHLKEFQKILVNAKDEAFKARGTEAWKEKKLAEKTASALVSDHFREITEMNRYYQNEFKQLRDKRDEELRKLNARFSEERSKIDMQVEQKPKEEKVNYWKQKFYRAAEEIKELKKKITDAA